MHQKENRPGGGTPGAALDCNSQRDCSQHTPNQGNNKAPAAGNASRRLIPAARHIQVVHHGSATGVHTWHVVVYDGASRTSVANFATKREAISQLEFLSQKLRARIVGRGAPR
jgi:hypothetical protein